VPFFHAFGVHDPPVTGALSLKGNMRGETGTYATLNGEASLVIEKGYFQKLSAAAKIIGILNLPTLLAGKVDFSRKGMPFDCLDARVVVKNGLAKVERYVVDSPIMKMTAAGDYDIPNNNANMVMEVSPLGSYEEFFQGLPVFGKLFVGDGQELVTAFYEVKGPLEDPRVKLLPIKSVASGVGALALLPLDIMKSVFFLPKELLAPTKRPPSPCAAF
jgi:AsmA-like C-terminal region